RSLLAEAAVVQPGAGEHFFHLLIEDPRAGKSDEPRDEDTQFMKDMLPTLSPRGAAAFIYGISKATDDEVAHQSLANAFLSGVSVKADVGGDVGGAKVGVGVG